MKLSNLISVLLERLGDAHFPGDDYSDTAVKVGKLHHVDKPDVSDSSVSGPMQCIYWDTLGPMRSCSIQGFTYCSTALQTVWSKKGCTPTRNIVRCLHVHLKVMLGFMDILLLLTFLLSLRGSTLILLLFVLDMFLSLQCVGTMHL